MYILIVDDDENILDTLEMVLRRDGHVIQRATTGAQALNIVQEGVCDLVICDWMMPEMSGVDLCRTIRHDFPSSYIYCILLTGLTSAEDRIRGLSAGADDYIAKPFNPDELLLRVRTADRLLHLETREVTIFAMAKLAESRDPDTGAHLERVQTYCRLIAKELARSEKFEGMIDRDFIRLIYQTSPLHDIGKVGIPDDVLLKPGRLTSSEFDVMKTHTTIGANTLEAALRRFPGARFLQMARDIAATHHEWFNGSGYPARLGGDNIPLAGRIVALADVYDALTSKRVYKEAADHETAKAMILAERGTHFDPDVVDAFLRVESQFLVIRESMHEAIAA